MIRANDRKWVERDFGSPCCCSAAWVLRSQVHREPAITGIKDGRVLGRFDLDALRGPQLLPADGMVGCCIRGDARFGSTPAGALDRANTPVLAGGGMGGGLGRPRDRAWLSPSTVPRSLLTIREAGAS